MNIFLVFIKKYQYGHVKLIDFLFLIVLFNNILLIPILLKFPQVLVFNLMAMFPHRNSVQTVVISWITLNHLYWCNSHKVIGTAITIKLIEVKKKYQGKDGDLVIFRQYISITFIVLSYSPIPFKCQHARTSHSLLKSLL